MTDWKTALLDDFDGVRRRIEKTSRFITSMLESVNKRINVERSFADALSASSLPSYDDCYPSISAANFVLGDHSRRRAEHSRRFAAALESQVAPAISAILEHADEVLVPMIAEGSKIQKELHQEYRAHDDAVISFDASSRVADVASGRALRVPPEPRARLKAAEAARLASERERLYAAAIAAVNKRRAVTAAALEPVMDALETAERKRLQAAEDAWRNFLAFEMEFTKSSEFDLNSTLKAACAEREISDTANFLTFEVAEVTTKRGKPPGRTSFDVEMKPLTWLELQSTMPAGPSVPPAFPVPSTGKTDAAARDWIVAFLRPKITDGVTEVQLTDEEFQELKKSTLEFLDAKFLEAAKLICAICRKIIGTQNLHAEIHEHEYFNLSLFWEEMAATCVADFFVQPQRKRSLAGSTEILLFDFLHVPIEEFPALTDAFGLSPDFTRDLVTRVLDSHAELVGDSRAIFEIAMFSTSTPLKVAKPVRP